MGSDVTSSSNSFPAISASSSGALTFNPRPDFETMASFSAKITANDGINTTDQDIQVNITDVENEGPVFSSEVNFTADENQTAIGTVVAEDPFGASVSYTLSGTDASAMTLDASSGELVFNSAPDYETKASYSATVTATGGNGATAENITVTINNLNDNAPVFTSAASFSIDENLTTIGNVSATDADGDNITYSLSGTDASALSINSTSGALSFNSAADYETKNSYLVTIQASDSSNVTNQNITVTIKDINEAPIITSGSSFSANENQSDIGSITATDESSNLIYELSGTDSSSISINNVNGKLTFNSAPDYESKNNYSAIVKVSDDAFTTQQAFEVNIINLNDNSPVFTSSASFNIDENLTAIGNVTATDADGDSLNYSISGSDLAINSAGELTFISAPDYETTTSYSATVTASDGTNSATQNITVNINDLNDTSPEFTSAAAFSADENQTAIGTVTATDADAGSSVTFSISGSEIAITSAGVLTFNLAPDHETKSSYTATVTATDSVNSTTQDITVAINDLVDVAPIITSSANWSSNERHQFNGNPGTTSHSLTATADAGAAITWTLSGGADLNLNYGGCSGSTSWIQLYGGASGGSNPRLQICGTFFDYESPKDANGDNIYEVEITASDGVNSTTQLTYFTIINVNDNAPVVTSGTSFTALENQTSVGTATGSDADGDSLTFSLDGSDADNFNINSSTGVISFISAPDYETKSSYAITVRASDGIYTGFASVNVLIGNENDNAPQFNDSYSSCTFISANCSITRDERIVEGGYLDTYNVAYSDNDNNKGPRNRSDTITLSFSGTDKDLFETTNDCDGDSELSFYKVCTFRNKTPLDFETKASYSFNVTLSDGIGNTSEPVAITVTDLDLPPYWINNSSELCTIAENIDSLCVDINGDAVDNDTLNGAAAQTVFYSFSTNGNGSVNGGCNFNINGESSNPSSNGLINTSSCDYEDATSEYVDIKASDGNSFASGVKRITAQVTNVEEAPVFTSTPNIDLRENGTNLNFNVQAYDPDGNSITYSLANVPSGSGFSINSSSGALSVSTAPDYETNQSFSFDAIANDGTSQTTQNITINIINLNDNAPVITSTCSPCTADENQTADIYTMDATDADGSTLYWGLSGDTDSGSGLKIYTAQATGKKTLTWNNTTPDYETKSSYNVTIKVFDSANANEANLTEQAVTVTINNLNDNSPVFTSSATFSAAENQTAIGTVAASDADGNSITYSISGTDASSMSINSSSGVLTFNEAPDYETKNSYSVTATASDGTNSTTQAITVNVTN